MKGTKIMDKLNIAFLQLLPEKTVNDNLKKGITACKKAKEMGADIILFPEMWSCGYSIPRGYLGAESYGSFIGGRISTGI